MSNGSVIRSKSDLSYSSKLYLFREGFFLLRGKQEHPDHVYTSFYVSAKGPTDGSNTGA